MDVIFEPQRGRPFSIEVGFFDTVQEIKQKIQKYQGIPISRQTLVLNGQVLQDERDVEYCEIFQNSHIQLLIDIESIKSSNNSMKVEEFSPPTTKVQLNVKVPPSKPNVVPMDMEMNDSLVQLKEKANNETEDGPVNVLAFHSANTYGLQDRQSVGGCNNVLNKQEIDAVAAKHSPPLTPATPTTTNTTGSKKLKVMVLTKGGTRKIPVEVNASDNVGDLRKELQRLQQRLHFHLPSEGYFFIYKQNVMDEDRSFRWHHVAQGDTIEIFNGSVTGGS